MSPIQLMFVTVVACLWPCMVSLAGGAEFSSTWSNAGDVDGFQNRSGQLSNPGQDGKPGRLSACDTRQ